MTPKQNEIYNIIKMYIETYKHSPSYKDIAERAEVSDMRAYYLVKRLVEMGYVNKSSKARSLSINKTEDLNETTTG